MFSTKMNLLLLAFLTFASGVARAQDSSDYVTMRFVTDPSADERPIDKYASRSPNNTHTQLLQEDWMDPANTNRRTVIRQAYISGYGGAGSPSCAVFLEIGVNTWNLNPNAPMSITDDQTGETVQIKDVVTLQQELDSGVEAARRYIGRDWVGRFYYVIALSRSHRPASCSSGASFSMSSNGSTFISHAKIVTSP